MENLEPQNGKNESAFTDNLEVKEPQENKPKNKSPMFYYSVILIASVILSSFFGGLFGYLAGGISKSGLGMLSGKYLSVLNPNGKTNTAPSVPASVLKENIVQEDSAITDVVDKSSPATVSIVISKDVPKISQFNFGPFGFPDFFGDQNPSDNSGGNGSGGGGGNGSGGTTKQTIGGGTGFFISEDGMIVTNKHVVADTTADYTAITTDGKEHVAKVLARDPVNDIAIIKIDGNGYPTLNFGNSDTLKIGQTVSNTVSKGIISGLKRKVTAGSGFGDSEKLNDIIQTDAAINPGNSGGPLLDIDGNVIGVNVAIAQGAQNIGFAIPASQVKSIADEVKATGKITTPYLGVRYVPVDANIQQQIGLNFNYGVLVVRGDRVTDFAVVPGSPADKAGIVENDVIMEINGTKINQDNSLTQLISKLSVGDKVTLKVWHKGDIKDVSLTLEEKKN